jgi:mRNA-degrading endonuclease toxin of MazEF toxin-antitoxin module
VSQNHGGGLVITRGEVWLVAQDPTIGSEIPKIRPCLIVSPLEMNDRLSTIIAAPMTTGSRPAPSRIPVRFQGRSGPSCWSRFAPSTNAGLSGGSVPLAEIR